MAFVVIRKFPEYFSVTKVVPIFKSGDKKLPINDRPVSIIPICSRVLEFLMHEQLKEYFNSNNLLSECQLLLNFRKGISITTGILNIVTAIIDSVGKNQIG